MSESSYSLESSSNSSVKRPYKRVTEEVRIIPLRKSQHCSTKSLRKRWLWPRPHEPSGSISPPPRCWCATIGRSWRPNRLRTVETVNRSRLLSTRSPAKQVAQLRPSFTFSTFRCQLTTGSLWSTSTNPTNSVFLLPEITDDHFTFWISTLSIEVLDNLSPASHAAALILHLSLGVWLFAWRAEWREADWQWARWMEHVDLPMADFLRGGKERKTQRPIILQEGQFKSFYILQFSIVC